VNKLKKATAVAVGVSMLAGSSILAETTENIQTEKEKVGSVKFAAGKPTKGKSNKNGYIKVK
jgi:hypothetical protein